MLEILKNFWSGQNQFASGGLLLMIIGGIAAYLRQVPLQILAWVRNQATMMITVKDEDVAFAWVKEWFLEQKFLRRVRRLDLDTTLRNDHLALIPAPGKHWFWHAGRPFVVYFSRIDSTGGWTAKRVESLTFLTVGRDQAVLRQFVDEIIQCHANNIKVRCSLFVFDESWTRVEGYAPRTLDSVILDHKDKEKLLEDVRKFRASKSRYCRLGVPYHRGYLFYGPPGTGKTSLVSAVAASCGMSLYLVNLEAFNDRSLMQAMNDIPGNSVILFEDIDCMKSGTSRVQSQNTADASRNQPDCGEPSKFGVTLSGLLNVLDGFNAPENVLFVMTSNRIEVLDSALLRPGRIDYRLFLGEASTEQKVELYRRFFPGASEIEAKDFVGVHGVAQTMAEFQGVLLALEDECAALESIASL